MFVLFSELLVCEQTPDRISSVTISVIYFLLLARFWFNCKLIFFLTIKSFSCLFPQVVHSLVEVSCVADVYAKIQFSVCSKDMLFPLKVMILVLSSGNYNVFFRISLSLFLFYSLVFIKQYVRSNERILNV